MGHVRNIFAERKVFFSYLSQVSVILQKIVNVLFSVCTLEL